jgi:hypothetical protein
MEAAETSIPAQGATLRWLGSTSRTGGVGGAAAMRFGVGGERNRSEAAPAA